MWNRLLLKINGNSSNRFKVLIKFNRRVGEKSRHFPSWSKSDVYSSPFFYLLYQWSKSIFSNHPKSWSKRDAYNKVQIIQIWNSYIKTFVFITLTCIENLLCISNENILAQTMRNRFYDTNMSLNSESKEDVKI